MSCPRTHRLADHLQGRETSEELAAHLESCESCRRASTRLSAALEGLKLARDMVPPDPGEARVMAMARWLRPPAPQPARRWAGFVYATAMAALLLAGGFGWRHFKKAPVVVVASAPAPVKPSPPPAEVQQPLEAIVTLLGGEVSLVRSSVATAVTLSELLRSEDRVQTTQSARLGVQWGQGSGLLLLENAALSFARLEARNQELDLDHGKVFVRVGQQQPGENLVLLTAAHRVTARLSWFSVACGVEETAVEVLEGTVEVAALDGSTATIIHAPGRAVFRSGKVASAPLSHQKVRAIQKDAEMNLAEWVGLAETLKKTGMVNVHVEPAGQVAIDGISLGVSPITVRRPLGKHLVEVTRVGWKPQRAWTAVATTTRLEELKMDLERAPEKQIEDPFLPEELDDILRHRALQIRACYERGLKRNPTLGGSVSLRLRIGKTGKIREASVEDSTLDDVGVPECLRHEAMSWSFPESRNSTVVYPFVFRAEN